MAPSNKEAVVVTVMAILLLLAACRGE